VACDALADLTNMPDIGFSQVLTSVRLIKCEVGLSRRIFKVTVPSGSPPTSSNGSVAYQR
jgi:hypothetical protein